MVSSFKKIQVLKWKTWIDKILENNFLNYEEF